MEERGHKMKTIGVEHMTRVPFRQFSYAMSGHKSNLELRTCTLEMLSDKNQLDLVENLLDQSRCVLFRTFSGIGPTWNPCWK